MFKIRSMAALFSAFMLLAACQSAPQFNPLPAAQALRSQSQSGPIQTQSYSSAKDGLTWAEFEARDWDFSARLAKVEGRWVDKDGRSFEWTYYFTSFRKDKALKVTSRRDKEEVPDRFFGGGFSSFSWRVDSDEALKQAEDKGLKNFPVYEMELDSFLEWTIRSSDGYFRIPAR